MAINQESLFPKVQFNQHEHYSKVNSLKARQKSFTSKLDF